MLSLNFTPGNHEVVDVLLRSEADTSIPDDSEKTLIDLAKQQSNWIELISTANTLEHVYVCACTRMFLFGLLQQPMRFTQYSEKQNDV